MQNNAETQVRNQKQTMRKHAVSKRPLKYVSLPSQVLTYRHFQLQKYTVWHAENDCDVESCPKLSPESKKQAQILQQKNNKRGRRTPLPHRNNIICLLQRRPPTPRQVLTQNVYFVANNNIRTFTTYLPLRFTSLLDM